MRDAALVGASTLNGATSVPRRLVHLVVLVLDVTHEVALIPKDIAASLPISLNITNAYIFYSPVAAVPPCVAVLFFVFD
jgi:hypothetical protein